MSEVVSRDFAEQEFVRILKARLLETDVSEMSKAELKKFNESKDFFCKQVMAGNLSCSEGLEVTYSCLSGERKFTFKDVTGATYLKPDLVEGNVHKVVEMLGELTGQPVAIFGKLHQKDFFNLKEILQIFLD